MTNYTATLARAFSSPVVHYLNRGTPTGTYRTMCGKDATLMARYSPTDLRSGDRAARYCKRCGA